MQTLGSSPAADGDFSREKAAILKSAPRGKDGHPLAPNGKRSNLTEDQWAAVRTKNFKRWFGDWHRLEIEKQVFNQSPTEIRIPKEWETLTTDELRDRIEAELVSLAESGKPLEHPEVGNVSISKGTGVKKIINASRDPAKLFIAGDLRNAFAASRYIEESPAEGTGQNVVAFEKLLGRVTVAGRNLAAIYTVRRMRDGRQFYNTVALEEMTPAVSPGDTPASGERATPAYAEVKQHLRQPYQRVNPETVSKIVDENGEPRAVFHGTASEFDTFNKNAAKLYWDDEHGFFFETSKRFAKDYADAAEVMLYQSGQNRNAKGRVISAFLDIKNPAEEDFTGEYDTPAEWIDQHFDTNYADDIKARGHDGAVFTSNGEKVIVAFEPNQIKSATGNNGAFSPDNPSTLGSSPSPESDPVQVALAKMPEIYRQVFEAIEGGASVTEVTGKFKVTPRGADNILNSVRSRNATAIHPMLGCASPCSVRGLARFLPPVALPPLVMRAEAFRRAISHLAPLGRRERAKNRRALHAPGCPPTGSCHSRFPPSPARNGRQVSSPTQWPGALP